MEKNVKYTSKGITLIALVITIIVLLILASVTIATLTGKNGLLSRAGEAKENTGQANADEQVQVAVLGSIGKDGNIINGELKNNLNQIDKIEDVPEEITDETYPFTVKVDGYKVKIFKDGTVKKPGKWEQTKNDQNETIITDGTTKIKIGAYIDYDPTNGGEIKDDKVENGVEYSYKSAQGTFHATNDESIQDTSSNMERGNGYADQYYSVNAQTNGWRVLGFDEETDEILLISADVVKTESTSDGDLYFKGETAYEWGIDELNDICGIYGNGKGASGARSITVEDIDRITNYNPLRTGNGKTFEDGKINEYGNKIIYTKKSNGIGYNAPMMNNVSGTYGNANTIFRYYDEEKKKWITLEEGQNIEFASTEYYYSPITLTTSYDGEQLGIAPNSPEYEMLFSGTSSGKGYWLANRMTHGNLGFTRFGFRCVESEMVYRYNVINSNGGVTTKHYGVRPIVSLEENVNISGGDGESVATAYKIQ